MSQREIEQTRLAQNCVKIGGHAQRVQAESARVADPRALADMNEALERALAILDAAHFDFG